MEAQPDVLTPENYRQWKHRWERQCLPYRRLIVRTTLTEAEIEARVSERLLPPMRWRHVGRRYKPDERNFRGSFRGDRFTLSPHNRAAFIPVAKGLIEQGNGARTIRILVRPYLGTIPVPLFGVFPALWIGWLYGWSALAVPQAAWPVYVFGAVSLFMHKGLVGTFFRDAAIVPVFFSSIGDVTFED